MWRLAKSDECIRAVKSLSSRSFLSGLKETLFPKLVVKQEAGTGEACSLYQRSHFSYHSSLPLFSHCQAQPVVYVPSTTFPLCSELFQTSLESLSFVPTVKHLPLTHAWVYTLLSLHMSWCFPWAWPLTNQKMLPVTVTAVSSIFTKGTWGIQAWQARAGEENKQSGISSTEVV